MKRHFWYLAGIPLLLTLGIFAGGPVMADDRTSDQLEPNRYAVINSRLIVRTQTGNNATAIDTVCRIDTVTGKVWVLQGEIHQPSDPRFTRIQWIPVTELSVMEMQQLMRHHRQLENNDFAMP